ncbi:nitrite/sulfite reductase [Paracraurococcus lichenis]|uniref:Nitrite/sulfite reductase n=1 Tax=Paracraurococcus lichenis TaxID=3064888 RepID=A0ABT9DY51_9PROT|nr:nitrite/sulfite reductase [Paracraurococcus sp. LOR1-02]MDO9708834.1 nitrite/sulfite reductase [Paracraurococcus sp. LOR1-02]
MNALVEPIALPAPVYPPDARTYRYDEVDREFLQERIAEFSGQVERRLRGELTEDEFKPLRLMNGLYLQLHAYMHRICIPYGVLNATQLRQLAMIARRWDRGYGHFTTRTNIQFNWIALKDVPDIMRALADVDMHSIQTSGNCIRNTTIDEYAGAAPDEVVDPRIYAEIIRQWSTLHPEFTWLPRKFKVAITGASHDRAAIQIHDVGLQAKRNAEGAIGFEVWVGGGLGRTPILATKLRDWVPEEELLAYLEAVIRVYNALGQRENIHKARIKILVRDLGEDYRERVEREFARLPKRKYRLDPEIVEQIAAHFAPPPFAPLADNPPAYAQALAGNPDFAAWAKQSVRAHKAPGYASVTISLKPIGGIPGDCSAEQMEAVAALAEAHAFGEIRVSHVQNLVLPHVRQEDLLAVWQGLRDVGLATPNIGLISDIIACPGMDFCSLATARSIPVAQMISERFADLDRQHDIGECFINISGCINACGHHHVGHIGILGVDKRGAESYQITLGGSATNDAALGELVGPGFPYDKVTDAVETILRTYLAHRSQGERFVDTYRRIGLAPFKEALYAAA